jgi:hypothetical protein
MMRSATTGVAGLLWAVLAVAPSHALGFPKRPPLAPRAQVLAQAPQPGSRIEVLVLEGSNGPGGIAPGLQNLRQLSRMPFRAYSQISVVSRTTLPLGAAPAQTVALPNGGNLQVTLSGRQPNGRFAVSVQLTHGGRTHNMDFAATVGDPFFTVRQTGAASALILGFIIR